MGPFFAYTLYSGIFLLAFYLLYRLFVSGEKQIALNRAILLGCYAVAFAAWPIFNSNWDKTSSDMTMVFPTGELNVPSMILANGIEEERSILPDIILWIYLIGASVVLLKTFYSVARLMLHISKGEFLRKDGYTLVVMPDKTTAPFSFGSLIVMNAYDYETVCEAVTAHELAHIRCRHYLDLLLAQMVCVMLWYDPAAWLMRDELKLIHEYQADAAVIDGGVDPKEYQMLLIRKTVGNRFHILANNLNHSKLKNRIAMMQKERSGGLRRMRIAALAIALAVALVVVNIPALASGLKSLETASLRLSPDHSLPDPDTEAEFPGGTDALIRYLSMNVRYPQSAHDEDRTGKTVVGFTVQSDGSISDVKIEKSAWPDLDEEAVRVVRSMPDWTPATKDGKPVASGYTLPVNFILQSQEAAEATSSIQGAPFIQLSKNGGAKLMLGRSDKDCDANDLQTVRVDGKLMKENMVIDLSDIELSETFPPSEEFPGGLWDIKLKKK